MTTQRTLTPVGLILAVLLATVAAQAAETRWRPLPIRSAEQYALGMLGGAGEQHMHSMTRSVSDPDIIFLSHDCSQLWRSDNGGDTWHKLQCWGIHGKSSQSVEVDPVRANIVLAMVDSGSDHYIRPHEGLFRSTDYGESWQRVLQISSEGQRFYQHCIAYDPASTTKTGAQVWYFGVPANGLYRSDDAGLTWTQTASLASYSYVYAVYAHQTDGQTVYVATNQGLLRSTDRGETLTAWGNLPSGEVSCLALHPTDPNTMFATVRGTGLYKSTDGGASFSLLRSTDATGVFVNPGHPNVIYLTSLGSDLVVSQDGGTSWSTPNVNHPLGLQRDSRDEIDGPMTGISPDPRDPDVAVCYSNAWLSKTTDGANFSDTMALFTGYNWGWWNDAVAYDVGNPDRFIFFCADIGMVITEDGGLTWERHKAPWSWYSSGLVSWRGMYAGDFYPVTGSDFFVASIGMYFSCKLLNSTNGGVSYNLIEADTENYLFVAYNTDNPNIVYAGNKRSLDGGYTFEAIPYLQTYGGSILGMCKAQPNTIYALDSGRRMIFRSDDAGTTWRLYSEPGWDFKGIDSKPTFEVDPADPDKIYTLDANSDLATFDGTTWTTLPVLAMGGDVPYSNYIHGIKVDPRYPNIIYVKLHATGFPTLFRSVDSGQTWEDITYNHPLAGSGAMSVHPLTGDLMISAGDGTRVLAPPYDSPNSIYYNCPTEPPIARAGDDQLVIDADGDGQAIVQLDASESKGPGADLAMFQWSADGLPVASGETTAAFLSVGTHEIVLSVYDETGAMDIDPMTVTVVAATPGDADLDGDVDLSDFIILKTNFGRTDAAWTDGDFDDDGSVNLNDFVLLKTNFGT